MERPPLLSTAKGWIALVAVAMIPLLYSGFYLGAFWNPYGHLHRLTVAVVNRDHGDLSRQVIRAMKRGNRVVVTTAAQGDRWLQRGTVAELATIPKGYTLNMQKGRVVPLTFHIDDGINYLQSLIMARQIEAVELGIDNSYQSCAASRIKLAATNAGRLARSSAGLATSLEGLHRAASRLSSHETTWSTKAQVVAKSSRGAVFSREMASLATDADSLSSGVGKLASGIQSAARGANKIAEGNKTLSQDLGAFHGRAVLPYTRYGRVITRHKVRTYGEGLAPYFLSLSLWVGALVATVLVPGGPRQWLLLRQRVSLGLSLAQVALLGAGIFLLLPFRHTHVPIVIGALAAIGVTWWAVVRMLAEKLGDAGRIIAIALLVIQLAGSGGTYPMALSSSFFLRVHPYLPMTWAVDLLRYAISGSLAPEASTNLLRLLALMVATVLVTRLVPGHWRFDTPSLEARPKG